MIAGIQKWALLVYLVLCVFLLSRPSPEKIAERADALDKQLDGQNIAALGPALASALDMPFYSVDCFLNVPECKPSSLVFNKLLERCGSQPCDVNPAKALIDAGMSVDDAIEYFDDVERRVMDQLNRAQTRSKSKNPPFASASGPAAPHASRSVRSMPD